MRNIRCDLEGNCFSEEVMETNQVEGKGKGKERDEEGGQLTSDRREGMEWVMWNYE